jgi:hypothetical protein
MISPEGLSVGRINFNTLLVENNGESFLGQRE